jgi:pimeloyl-ACP methyl ester carboxylesterase
MTEHDQQTTPDAPGDFIELTHGKVHYELVGSEEGQVVALMHGFSIPSYTWDKNIIPLAEAGFRALRFDLYGRGFSDHPVDVDYKMDLFEDQLGELLESLDIKDPVDVVGHAMGGLVAAGFASRFPERVRRVVLVAPLAFYMELPKPQKRAFRMPLVGDRLVQRTFDPERLCEQAAESFLRPDAFPEFQDKFRAQMEIPGFDRAIYATARQLFVAEMRKPFEDLVRNEKTVHLFWGREDGVYPMRFSEALKKVIPDLELHIIEEAGHAAHYEQAEAFNQALIDALKETT